jgi:hypothetical protein
LILASEHRARLFERNAVGLFGLAGLQATLSQETV